MAKAILFLILIAAAVIGFMVYQGYTRVSGKDPLAKTAAGSKTAQEGKETRPGDNLLNRAGEIAGETVKRGAQEVKEALKTDLKLTVSPSPIEVSRGGKAEAKIVRGTSALPALQLALHPAGGSRLTVSGGQFAEGAREAALTVEAPADAQSQDVTLTLKYEDYAKPVPVRIK